MRLAESSLLLIYCISDATFKIHSVFLPVLHDINSDNFRGLNERNKNKTDYIDDLLKLLTANVQSRILSGKHL